MVSRLLTPGLSSGSKRTSVPESVTAERIFLALTDGSSSISTMPCRAGGRLGHLRGGVLEVADLGGGLEDVGLGQPEGLLVAAVEPLREVAGQLEVLALVLADRDVVRPVEQDVGRLEDRVGEQPDARRALAALGRLVLELGHPAGLAEAGQALQHPRRLGVRRDLALHEDRRPLRVDAHGQQLRGGPQRPLAQRFGSCSTVIACRSAMKKNGAWSRCRSTHCRSAPR